MQPCFVIHTNVFISELLKNEYIYTQEFHPELFLQGINQVQFNNVPSCNNQLKVRNQWKVKLALSDEVDLISFIKTLRDETFMTNPAFSSPGKLPDWTEAIK